jgi:hypothetical protein
MKTSSLPAKGCKKAYTRRSGLLSREESLSCHICDTDLGVFFSASSEGPPNLVASYDNQWDAENLVSNPDPHGSMNVKIYYM